MQTAYKYRVKHYLNTGGNIQLFLNSSALPENDERRLQVGPGKEVEERAEVKQLR